MNEEIRAFLIFDYLLKFIEAAVKQYERGPAWFVAWLEDLYQRAQEDMKAVSLYELMMLQRLYDAAGWQPESFAINAIYKMQYELGRDTTGMIDH